MNHPAQARAYLALDTAGKRAYLKDTVAKQSLSDIVLWTKPREIDTVEWFGSPRDVCRAYAGLLKLGGKEVNAVMSANDVGLGLDRKKWPLVSAKGGSEMGVLDLSYTAARPREDLRRDRADQRFRQCAGQAGPDPRADLAEPGGFGAGRQEVAPPGAAGSGPASERREVVPARLDGFGAEAVALRCHSLAATAWSVTE